MLYLSGRGCHVQYQHLVYVQVVLVNRILFDLLGEIAVGDSMF